jgi:peptidoglycan hydrolase-like protein with peptidoglycan-binding domain
MRKNKFSRAIFIGGAVTLLAAPVWSQEVPGERKQPDRNLTRPSEGEENIPGVRGQGTTELSKSDFMKVEEALKAKGFDPGKIDGIADDTSRGAVRAFQKEKGLTVTGTVDSRTADQLGVTVSKASDSPGSQGMPKSEGRSQGRDSDTSIPQKSRGAE